jgi:hypothetical protein
MADGGERMTSDGQTLTRLLYELPDAVLVLGAEGERQLGCRIGQGSHLGVPLDARGTAVLLRTRAVAIGATTEL